MGPRESQDHFPAVGYPKAAIVRIDSKKGFVPRPIVVSLVKGERSMRFAVVTAVLAVVSARVLIAGTTSQTRASRTGAPASRQRGFLSVSRPSRKYVFP